MVIFLMSALRAVSSSSSQGAPVDTDQRACMSLVRPWAPKGLWEETGPDAGGGSSSISKLCSSSWGDL